MNRSALVAPILLGIVVRVAVALAAWSHGGPAVFLTPDSYAYLNRAATLATRFAFENERGQPEVFRTPGYPLVLAAGYAMGHPILFALAVQFALAAVIVVVIAAWVTRLAGARWGVVSAWVAALEPVMLLWSMKVMAETQLALWVLVFAWSACRAAETRLLRWVIAAAAAVSLAAYTKPIAYPLALLACAAAFVPLDGRTAGRYAEALRRGAVAAAACAVLLVPWHLRNARTAGYAGFSSLTDYALYVSVGGSIEARHTGQAFADVRTRRRAEAAATPRPPYAAMRRDGWARLWSDLPGYAGTHLQGMVRTLVEPGAVEYLRLFGGYEGHRGALMRTNDVGLVRAFLLLAREQPHVLWPTVVLAIVLGPLVVLPAIAALRLAPHERLPFAILAFTVAWFVTAGGGVPGSNRFRVPAIPLLIVMSALGAASFRRAGTLGP
jgi:hypothetical protein